MSPTTQALANTSSFVSSTMILLSVTKTLMVPLATSLSNHLVGPIATTVTTSVVRSGVSQTTVGPTDTELLTPDGVHVSLVEITAVAVGASFCMITCDHCMLCSDHLYIEVSI